MRLYYTYHENFISSHVRKGYIANQNGVQLFSHVDVYPIDDSVNAFEPIRVVHRTCNQMVFQIREASKFFFRKKERRKTITGCVGWLLVFI